MFNWVQVLDHIQEFSQHLHLGKIDRSCLEHQDPLLAPAMKNSLVNFMMQVNAENPQVFQCNVLYLKDTVFYYYLHVSIGFLILIFSFLR